MMLVMPLAIAWIGAAVLAPLDGRRRRVGELAIAVLTASLIAAIVLAVNVIQDGPQQQVAGNWAPGVGIVFRADALGVIFAVLSIGVLLAALTFEVIGGVHSSTFPALVLFLATGLTGLFLTGDVFNFYVFFEISMIASYILTSYGEGRRQFRAAANFIVVNLLGSVLFLIGIAALYRITGRLDMAEVAQRIPLADTKAPVLAATLIFVAFSIKLGIFPFHFWLAAVYTGTRPAVAAILSGALANIGSYGLLRFGGEVLPKQLEFGAPVLYVVGTMSILYGAMQAISRRSVAEVLAYSSIGQVGYIMIALAIGGRTGFAAVVLYAVVNSLNKTLLFLSENLRGWLVGAAFVTGAFSVAGVPPSAGFFGKAALYRASLTDDQILLVALIFIGGALSFVYMFQIYQQRYWLPEEDSVASTASRLQARLLVLAIAGLVVAIGIWPEPLLSLSKDAADVLMAGPS
jgi:multicomponent Na+:H+ antiporter subunit D